MNVEKVFSKQYLVNMYFPKMLSMIEYRTLRLVLIELIKLCDARTHTATGHHSQSGRWSENMIPMMEDYIHLRCAIEQGSWDLLFAFVEFRYNYTFSADHGMSLFEVDPGTDQKLSLKVIITSQSLNKTWNDFKHQLHETLHGAMFS